MKSYLGKYYTKLYIGAVLADFLSSTSGCKANTGM